MAGDIMTHDLKSREAFQQAVLSWFDQHGRHDLPWQAEKTAYRTWLSEIMLQQTQVSTVIPYFQRFIERFPDLQSLAEADTDEVLHHWTGLGYYARARNLHKCAQLIQAEHQGEFPSSVEALADLPGIGRSTAGAIASIAFNRRAAILDGNVKRVLTRFHAVEGWSGTPAIMKQLWQYAEHYTPEARCADYTQAMMDLGATLCTRSKPDCPACPLQSDCAALKLGITNKIPAPKPRKTIPVRQTYMLILRNAAGDILLQQRPPTGIWGGLWSLPEVSDLAALDTTVKKQHTPVRHTFSHFHLDITPVEMHATAEQQQLTDAVMEQPQQLWYNMNQPAKVGLAAPVERLLQQLSKQPDSLN